MSELHQGVLSDLLTEALVVDFGSGLGAPTSQREGGRLLLRACLSTAGQRNDINIETVRGVFDG